MKVVAISQRIDQFIKRNEARDSLDQRLITFISFCGYMPVPLPNVLGSSINKWIKTINPAAIVLSGGNDIGLSADRDNTEYALLKNAYELQLPVLGICRGMQMMAHWAGTSLCPLKGHVRTRHRLLGEITGEVNSYHDFGLATCPKNFEVIARSEDGEIEAIRHQILPWEGWMWHPEREPNFPERDIQRLRSLFA
jgi:gamma-glutamyl-gamma-aminobutyrate hydrolase PuuD